MSRVEGRGREERITALMMTQITGKSRRTNTEPDREAYHLCERATSLLARGLMRELSATGVFISKSAVLVMINHVSLLSEHKMHDAGTTQVIPV